jgi:HSP20 family protein
MNLRSLVPFARDNRQNLARPELPLFGPLHQEIDRLFEDFSRGLGTLAGSNLMPSMDVAETDNEIEITAELPGLEQKDIDISVDDNVLTIRGEKKVEHEQKDKDYRVTERAYGVFYRALELPKGIDPSSIKATMSNGVLKITIPKPQRPQGRKIEVEQSKGQESGRQDAGAREAA